MNSFFDAEMADPDVTNCVESVVIHEDSTRGERVEFETTFNNVEGVIRRGFKAPFLAPDQLSDLLEAELVYITERKLGSCCNVQVSHDDNITGIVHIESVDGTPPNNRISFPAACYTDLCNAICRSLYTLPLNLRLTSRKSSNRLEEETEQTEKDA